MKKSTCLLFVILPASCGDVIEKVDGAACAPELDEVICSRLDKDCGELPTIDNCGQERIIACGACSGERQTCAAKARVCPQPAKPRARAAI